MKIKNADSWGSLGKPAKASGVLKSPGEDSNKFRKAAIEKEVKARTEELIQKPRNRIESIQTCFKKIRGIVASL